MRGFALAMVAAFGSSVATAAAVPAQPAPKPHTRAEMLALVVQDAAARAKVAEADVQVVHEEDRTWDDAGLGCPARKGLREASPVPGYRFILQAGDRTWEYHTDRLGRIKRCPPVKPRRPSAT
jgi:hypothetical protein